MKMSVLQRIVCHCMFAGALAVASEPERPHELSTDGANAEYVVSVNPDALANAVFPGTQPLLTPPRFDGLGVVREYRSRRTRYQFELRVGVYGNEELAARNLCIDASHIGRRQPPRLVEMLSPGSPVFVHGYVSARASHVRVHNVVAHARFSSDIPLTVLHQVWEDLYDALSNPAVVTMGSSVNAPRLEVLDVTRVSRYGPETDVGYKMILAIDGRDGVLFPERWGFLKARRLADGRYEVTGGRRPSFGGMPGRAERPTGEVCVLPVKELVDLATNVELVWWERGGAKKPVSETERIEIIEKLRNREGELYKQSIYAERLSLHPTADCVPLFLEILSSDRHGEIKKFALRGLAEMRRKEGLPNYREYAADRTQSRVIRRDAIMLIREFGTEQDLALLRRLGEEIKTWPEDDNEDPMLSSHETRAVFSRAVSSAIRRLEARP